MMSSTTNVVLVRVTREMMFSRVTVNEPPIGMLDVISKGDSDYKAMLQEEFSALTKLGNRFRIRHHETDKKDIGCNEHYDYLFHRCLSVLKLATSVLSEVKPDEV